MGEIASDMANGSCCSTCGQYFKSGIPEEVYSHGYPVLCRSCWSKQPSQERLRYKNSIGQQRALKKTF